MLPSKVNSKNHLVLCDLHQTNTDTPICGIWWELNICVCTCVDVGSVIAKGSCLHPQQTERHLHSWEVELIHPRSHIVFPGAMLLV